MVQGSIPVGTLSEVFMATVEYTGLNFLFLSLHLSTIDYVRSYCPFDADCSLYCVSYECAATHIQIYRIDSQSLYPDQLVSQRKTNTRKEFINFGFGSYSCTLRW